MPKKQDFNPLLDASQNEHGLTFSASDTLDTKALAILGADIALGLFVLQSEMDKSAYLLVPLFLALVASVIICVIIIWPYGYANKYRGAVVDMREHPEYLRLDEDQLLLQLISDTQAAIDQNAHNNDQKASLCIVSILATLMSLMLLVGCIL